MFRKDFLRGLCLLTFYQITFCGSLPVLGPADLNIKKIVQCENPEQYPSKFVVEKKKINRTHEIFNGDINLDIDFDETVSFYINVEKWGDGGYKPNYLIVNESNACEVLFKYVKKDAMILLEAAGRPPNCPIMAGSAHLTNHSLDYNNLPKEMLYGDFKARVFFMKDGIPKLCLEAYAESTPKKLGLANNFY